MIQFFNIISNITIVNVANLHIVNILKVLETNVLKVLEKNIKKHSKDDFIMTHTLQI